MHAELKIRAERALPGGVNSPVRAFRAVGGDPLFVRAARGARLETVDGRRPIDFCMSFGPLMLGHAHPVVVEAIREAAARGTSFAVTTEAEIELAELIRSAIPGMERVRLVSSGTEAAMTAFRLARGCTGRDKLLKFSGCYHGHSDSLLVEAGSGVAGMAQASSAGVPAALAALTLVAPFNDPQAVSDIVDRHGDSLAAIAVEPVVGNMGLVLPAPGFLEHLRHEADRCGALLVFDEVITGFRLTFGGYQTLCGVTPDLTCLGKVIGSGMPIGALGGRAGLMEQLAPLGPVYQAGTLSGNPVSVAAGLAGLRWLRDNLPYETLAVRTATFAAEVERIAAAAGLALQAPYAGSLFSLFFAARPPRNFAEVMGCDREPFAALFHALLARDVYLAPSPFECGFLSIAHDADVMAAALRAFEDALNEVGNAAS